MNGCVFLSRKKVDDINKTLKESGIENVPDNLIHAVATVYCDKNGGVLPDDNDSEGYELFKMYFKNTFSGGSYDTNAVSSTEGGMVSVNNSNDNEKFAAMVAEDSLNFNKTKRSPIVTVQKLSMYIKAYSKSPLISKLLNSSIVSNSNDPFKELARLSMMSLEQFTAEKGDMLLESKKTASSELSDIYDSIDNFILFRSLAPDSNIIAKIVKSIGSNISKVAATIVYAMYNCVVGIKNFFIDRFISKRKISNPGAILLLAMMRNKSLSDSDVNKISENNGLILSDSLYRSLLKSKLPQDKLSALTSIEMFFNDKLTDSKEASLIRSSIDSIYKNKNTNKSIIKYLEEIGIVLNGEPVDNITDDMLYKYAVVAAELQKLDDNIDAFNLFHLSTIKENDGKISISINNSYYSYLNMDSKSFAEAKSDISEYKKTLDDIHNYIISQKNEINKTIKALKSVGDTESVTKLLELQNMIASSKNASDLDQLNSIIVQLYDLQNGLSNKIYMISKDITRARCLSMDENDIVEYTKKMDSIYNSYISIMDSIRTQTSGLFNAILDNEYTENNKSYKLRLKDSALGIYKATGARNQIGVLLKNFNDFYATESMFSASKNKFYSMQSMLVSRFIDIIGNNENLNTEYIQNIKDQIIKGGVLRNDCTILTKTIGLYQHSRNDIIKIIESVISKSSSEPRIKAESDIRYLTKLANNMADSCSITPKFFIDKENGTPTGYIKSKYKLSKFEKDVDSAKHAILSRLNKDHEKDPSWNIVMSEQDLDDSGRSDFYDFMTKWYFGKINISKDGKDIELSNSPKMRITIDLSIYSGNTDKERIESAYNYRLAFGHYSESNYAELKRLNSIIENILKNKTPGVDLSDDESNILENVVNQKQLLGSIYNIDGSLKTGTDLENAKNFKKVTNEINSYRKTEYDTGRFESDFNSKYDSIINDIKIEMSETKKYSGENYFNDSDISAFEEWANSKRKELLDNDVIEYSSSDNQKIINNANAFIERITKWTNGRRFRKANENFTEHLSSLKKKDKTINSNVYNSAINNTVNKLGVNIDSDLFKSIKNSTAANDGSIIFAILKASLGMKRTIMARVAFNTNGGINGGAIKECRDLDLYYDNIGNSKYNKLISAYSKALEVYNDIYGVSVSDDSMLSEFYDRIYRQLGYKTVVNNTNGSTTIEKVSTNNDLKFGDVAYLELKPSAKRYKEEQESLLEATSDPRQREIIIERLKSLKIDENFGNVSSSKDLSAISNLVPVMRSDFDYRYSREYINENDESAASNNPSVFGIVPSSEYEDNEFNNFINDPKNASAKIFYDKYIETKQALDVMNNVINTGSSKYKLPIREADADEATARNLMSIFYKLSPKLSSLTDSEYAIYVNSGLKTLKDQSGVSLKNRTIPLSRTLNDMNLMSENILNSLYEYSFATHYYDSKSKTQGISRAITGIMNNNQTNNAFNTGSSEYKANSRFKTGDSYSISYEDSNFKKAYENMVSKSWYGISDNGILGPKARSACNIFKAIGNYLVYVLISTNLKKSSVNITQGLEGIMYKFVSDSNRNANSVRRAFSYVSKDIKNAINDNFNVTKKSKGMYLLNICGIVNNKYFDRNIGKLKNNVGNIPSSVTYGIIDGFSPLGRGGAYMKFGDILAFYPDAISRLFDFREIEYVVIDASGNESVVKDIMQYNDFNILLGKIQDNNNGGFKTDRHGFKIKSLITPDFNNAVAIPDMIDSTKSGIVVKDEFKDAFNEYIKFASPIVRGYFNAVKSSVNDDDAGPFITSKATSLLFLMKTWAIEVLFRAYGHIGGPGYSYRDHKMQMGFLTGMLRRLIGSIPGVNFETDNDKLKKFFDNDYIGTDEKNNTVDNKNSVYNVNRRDLNKLIKNQSIVWASLFVVYGVMDLYSNMYEQMNPYDDNRIPWWKKQLFAFFDQLFSENMFLMSSDLVNHLNNITYILSMFSSILGAAMDEASDTFYDRTEFYGAKKGDIEVNKILLPFSDVRLTGNDVSSEMFWLGKTFADPYIIKPIINRIITKAQISDFKKGVTDRDKEDFDKYSSKYDMYDYKEDESSFGFPFPNIPSMNTDIDMSSLNGVFDSLDSMFGSSNGDYDESPEIKEKKTELTPVAKFFIDNTDLKDKKDFSNTDNGWAQYKKAKDITEEVNSTISSRLKDYSDDTKSDYNFAKFYVKSVVNKELSKYIRQRKLSINSPGMISILDQQDDLIQEGLDKQTALGYKNIINNMKNANSTSELKNKISTQNSLINEALDKISMGDCMVLTGGNKKEASSILERIKNAKNKFNISKINSVMDYSEY